MVESFDPSNQATDRVRRHKSFRPGKEDRGEEHGALELGIFEAKGKGLWSRSGGVED